MSIYARLLGQPLLGQQHLSLSNDAGHSFPRCCPDIVHYKGAWMRSQTSFTRFVFFSHIPPSVYNSYDIKVYKKLIFLTTFPPPLVNVVCERPLDIYSRKQRNECNQTVPTKRRNFQDLFL